jgi:hypothetical protein
MDFELFSLFVCEEEGESRGRGGGKRRGEEGKGRSLVQTLTTKPPPQKIEGFEGVRGGREERRRREGEKKEKRREIPRSAQDTQK